MNTQKLSYSNWEYYLILAMTMVAPLIYYRGFRQLFALPKFGIFYFLLVIICGIAITKYLSLSTLIIYGDRKVFLLLTAAILLALISFALSIHRHTSLFGTYGRYEGLVTLVGYFIIFFIVSQIDWTRNNRLAYFTNAFIATASLASLIGILEAVGFTFTSGLNIGISQTATRASSTFGNPVFLGIYLAMSLPLIFMEIINDNNRKLLRKAILYTSLLVVSSALLLSASRSAWLGVLIGIIVIIILSPPKIRRLILINFLILNIIFSGFLVFTIRTPGETNISHRLVSLLKLGSEDLARVEMWKIGSRIIIDRPFFGSGPDTTGLIFPKYINKNYVLAAGSIRAENNIHNYPMELGITLGLPIVLILLSLIILILKNWFKQSSDVRALGLVGAVIAYIVAINFNPNTLAIGTAFWVMLGIISSVAAFKSNKRAMTINWNNKNIRFRQLLIGLVIISLMLSLLQIMVFFAADYSFNNGDIYLGSGLFEQAYQSFQRAAELNPHVNDYWDYQEIALIKLRQTGDVRVNQEISVLKKAISLNNYRWSNYIRLANAYIVASSYNNKTAYLIAAENALQKATALKPFSPISSYLQSYVFIERSQFNKGKQALNRSLELEPTYKPALELQERLNNAIK